MMILVFVLAAWFSTDGNLQTAPPPIIGRWDITIQRPDGDRSAWLEVRHSGTSTLVGQFVGMSGSARPISEVEFKNGEVRFSIPPQWEGADRRVSVVAKLEGERLTGSMTIGTGAPLQWSAVRAPSLRRDTEVAWGPAAPLLNGRDLSGWHAIGANEWEVAGGVLRNKKSGGNLVTDQTFMDFKLHAEFRYPAGSNSGIYLRGRYEVQIADMPVEEQTEVGSLGAVYGYLEPSERAALKPGEWQTFDITLAGRMVTVVLNGKTIISNREIPGITGAALDSNEGTPGPLLLQGDHGPIEYRNLTLAPGKLRIF
jgi:hypothetical protein